MPNSEVTIQIFKIVKSNKKTIFKVNFAELFLKEPGKIGSIKGMFRFM